MINAVSRARQGRSATLVVAGAMAAVFAGVAGLGLLASRNDAEQTDRLRRELVAYEDAIAPAAQAAGRAIVAGIRPDLADFVAGRITPEVWRADMAARAQEFSSARERIAAVRPPAVAKDAAARFDEAMSLYVQAAQALAQAGLVDGDARQRALDRGAELGEEGDRVYDRGAAVLQAARRSLGLPPSNRFPDKR